MVVNDPNAADPVCPKGLRAAWIVMIFIL